MALVPCDPAVSMDPVGQDVMGRLHSLAITLRDISDVPAMSDLGYRLRSFRTERTMEPEQATVWHQAVVLVVTEVRTGVAEVGELARN
ncbi:hypothetical protein NDU88_005872 [Pleurodeles waltl]|uniref:Uncharacterized protein n=1 Tax=Pleurodeles waltl TaxID=8319 RepID=A0AAV7QGB4_PLEWA|nr:hypothetical protein NDU88_005872 [Pleurodeles waltl]